jgi:hypothetical protein
MELQAEGQPLYMMVTLKTATRLRVLSTEEERRTRAQAPVAEAAMAGGAPLGVGTALLGDLGVKVRKKVSRAEALKLVAAEERALAAEYCEIERTPRTRFSLRGNTTKEQEGKPILRFKNDVSVFSGDHTSFGLPEAGKQDGDADKSDEEVYR